MLGALFAGAVIGFATLYRSFSKREETAHERLTARSVGAAFVDRSVAENIAAMTQDIFEIKEAFLRRDKAEQEKDREEELLAKAITKLREAEAELKGPVPRPKPG